MGRPVARFGGSLSRLRRNPWFHNRRRRRRGFGLFRFGFLGRRRLCLGLPRFDRGRCRCDLGQHHEILALGEDSRIDARVGDNERRACRQSLGNLLAEIGGDLDAVEHLGGIASLQADRHPASLAAPRSKPQCREDVSAKAPLGIEESDRRVEDAAKILPDEQVPRGRLGLAGDRVNLFCEIVGEGSGFAQTIRLLERLDGGLRLIPQSAGKILRLEIAKRRQEVLRIDDFVSLRAPCHKDA